MLIAIDTIKMVMKYNSSTISPTKMYIIIYEIGELALILNFIFFRDNYVFGQLGPKINIWSIYHTYLSPIPKQSMKIKMKDIIFH